MIDRKEPGITGRGRRWLSRLARNPGVPGGSGQYIRFFILGRSRTGSNLLRSLLNAHTRVEAYGEIFRNTESMDWDHLGYFQTERMHKLVLEDPVRFLDRRVYGHYPKQTRAVGFKMFYYHARDGEWQAVWPHLQQHREIRVVHMKRRNILETHLSRQRAEATDSWVNTDGKREEAPTIALDYQECLADFERTRNMEERYDALFSDHPKLLMDYEELAGDYSGSMRRVFEFLDLDQEPVRPTIYKQSHRPISATITNYAELKKKFAGSPWESFFIE